MKICADSAVFGPLNGFQLMLVAAPIVNSSGAVSPAARATASSTPDRMPGSAAGSTTVRMVRAWLDPSARLASRRSSGTSFSISSVERMTIGSIRQARARAPAKPFTPSTPKRMTQIV